MTMTHAASDHTPPTITLWGRRNSSNVRKVLWCAEEAGVAYASIEVGGAFGGNTTPEYRALNPNGLVPTLQDGALVLWESNAIVRYLAAQYAPALYPHAPAERALGDRWMDWTTSTFAGVFRDLFWGVLRTPEAERDHARIAAALTHSGELLARADAALAQQPYLSGEQFAMGDIPLGSFIYAWFEMPIERPELPHLQAWYARLRARPAYRRAVMTALT
ncbi:glutathione S-transferase [Xanthomonas perforans]|uniref:Glutathione S-transferase GstB n=6 Tax=Xanthomonas TaxID=338 RepID=A0A6L9VAW7_XANPE|nr:glutathione S-transferase [Xanthomonas phaseoli pv. dieffenbachiae]MBV6787717.1 glutathione S-transferase [Xanthomonas campestris pv. clerodendri]MBV6802864.1 glutathione S-transferase [Xanthomonas campestris pv. lawsoniae]MBV6844498.1 glutathione S-transferase [Xanthomonas campestris pv. paulliniae]MBV6849702.1 glutathione S-transferase [Xanthomonas campestris pv. heliotropii]MBV6855760.1 glutathione S-transferase [Xanthomonas campestris pv. mirabilis]MBV6861412.1 glutathione S-transferas